GEPDSEVLVSTLAANAQEPVARTTYPLPPPSAYLRSGTNVLAVQVFQSSLSSSDLGFDASLEAIVRETTPPSLATTTPRNGSTVDALAQLTVTFDEPVIGVVAAHLLVGGKPATGVVEVDPSTYTYSFPQPAYGEVSVGWSPGQTITDRAQPPNAFDPGRPEASLRFVLVDRTPPSVAGLTPGASQTVRELGSISVLFSEPVAGVEASDLTIQGQPASRVIEIAPSQFVFEFPSPPAGSVSVAWAPGHGITDRASPPNAFAGGSWVYRIDPTAEENPPYVSEFMASNTRGLRDDLGQFSDWIEIYNPSPIALNLDGWYLTDATNNLAKWRFPATTIPGNGFLVVFASGNDRRVPGAPLHTSFQLSAAGESVALVRPDGNTVSSRLEPNYPQQLPDLSYGVVQTPRGDAWDAGAAGVYFTRPTPGSPNLGGSAVPGPIVGPVAHAPNVPADGEDLVVTATVRPSFAPTASVRLLYKIQFGAEAALPMADDGTQGDGAAGDGVFGARIPASLSTPGQMIRYAILATDTAGKTSRWPLFPVANGSEEYLGTVVQPTNATSKLPVFHLFVAPNQMAGIDSESGGRASFFHDGEFYDNIYVELRGNTSAGLNKKSHRLEFNRGHELRHPGASVRTRRSALLAEHLDPTYLRQHLCFWFLQSIGVPSPFDYPVRVHLNGQFYQLAFHNDVIGKEQMERMGYDPNGALYKAVGTLTPDFYSTGVFQKLEPEGDPSRTDYLQLANGIRESATIATRRNTVFDLLDLPQVINHLAGTRWCAENDDVWANMSLYRDTHGDGLWRNIPFDMNASWGQLYGGSSPLEATVDGSKSHPLYGGSNTESTFNRLYDVIVRLPETRQMLLRRQRSVLDRMVQPPATPENERILETYVRQMTNLIAAEATIDRARWGLSPWAPNKTFAAGVGDLISQFIVPRRRHWYVTHSITNTARPIGINPSNNAGIPLAQPADARLEISGFEFNPSSGNQSQEYVALTNPLPYAVDISGWKLDGAVGFTFRPGTVVPTNSVLYVSPDVRQFRSRTSGPRGGQGHFVVGPYSGQLSARGETLALINDVGTPVASRSYSGAPNPAQRFLRVGEIHYHPVAAPASPVPPDDFEFVELHNLSPDTSLDLRGIRFVDGIAFDFTDSAMTNLAPGARVVVVANPTAFASRYGSGRPVAGTYSGRLDNGGERVRLLAGDGEEILDFVYDDDWQDATDGLGFSLVVIDETAEPDTWSDKKQWRAGSTRHGTPGEAETPPEPPPAAPFIVVQPAATSLVAGDPVVLSVVVTNTAALPLGVSVRRTGTSAETSSFGFFLSPSRTFFLALEGADTSPPWTSYAFVVTNVASPTGIPSAPAVFTYLDDTDRDGLGDAWEREYFGSLTPVAPDDADRDGMRARDEFLAGTNPTEPTSVLKLEATRTAEGPVLRCSLAPNRTYTIQVAESIRADGPVWTRLMDVAAEPGTRTVELKPPGGDTARWYRLVTPRQP
ncbi:MAG: lamin tail domain-containing protein, partial [Verrucomicrobiales bacterium]|nr:lamin tail domain-containing protein [Verrucomicrobiales bacterium]